MKKLIVIIFACAFVATITMAAGDKQSKPGTIAISEISTPIEPGILLEDSGEWE